MPEKPSVPRYFKPLLIIGMLTFGTTTMTILKILYQVKGVNIKHEQQNFDRPYFNTVFTFFGEVLCLAIFFVHLSVTRFRKRRASNRLKGLNQHETVPLISDDTSKETEAQELPSLVTAITGSAGYAKLFGIALGFACIDTVAGLLLSNALVFCPLSIVQILRGFVTVFAMIFRRVYLKVKPVRWQILGVSIVLLGLLLVGLSAILDSGLSDTSGIHVLIGVVMVSVGQVFSANLYVLEEKVMTKYSVPPLMLVGSEGIFAFTIATCVVCPIVNVIPGQDMGRVESYANSFYMTFHNTVIGALSGAYCVAITFWISSSILVNKLFSSVHRTLFANLRVVTIWVVMIIAYYATDHKMGEGVDVYTALEVFGFVLIFFGTIVHNDLWTLGKKIMCWKDPNVAPEEKE